MKLARDNVSALARTPVSSESGRPLAAIACSVPRGTLQKQVRYQVAAKRPHGRMPWHIGSVT